MPQTLQPSQMGVWAAFSAHQITAAVKAGVDLDLFTAIGEGHDTPARLAERTGASERGIRILADTLSYFGLLTTTGHSYKLSEESAMMLNARSPAYMGKALDYILNPHLLEGLDNLTEAVRRGGTAWKDGGSTEPEHPVWVSYATAFRAVSAGPAQVIARVLLPRLPAGARVLDVAASHGEYGMAILQANPQARVVALDWANVLKVTRQFVTEAGLSDRWEALPGSAFEVDLGTGYQAALVTNFLHCFGPTDNVVFLKRLHAALKPGGKVVIVQLLLSEDYMSAALFSLNMMASTPQGQAYTVAEYQDMLAQAGFGRAQLYELTPFPMAVLVAARS